MKMINRDLSTEVFNKLVKDQAQLYPSLKFKDDVTDDEKTIFCYNDLVEFKHRLQLFGIACATEILHSIQKEQLTDDQKQYAKELSDTALYIYQKQLNRALG